MVTPQTIAESKLAALDELYGRIRLFAQAVGGTATQHGSAVGFPGSVVAMPRAEILPALLLTMPGDFQVEITPSNPLTIGNVLSVQVRRTHGGLRKTDWGFRFGLEGWQRGSSALTDDEIRECLTAGGPPPVAY